MKRTRFVVVRESSGEENAVSARSKESKHNGKSLSPFVRWGGAALHDRESSLLFAKVLPETHKILKVSCHAEDVLHQEEGGKGRRQKVQPEACAERGCVWASQVRHRKKVRTDEGQRGRSLTNFKEVLRDEQHFPTPQPQHLHRGGLRLDEEENAAQATTDEVEACNNGRKGQDPTGTECSRPHVGLQQRREQVRAATL